MAPGLELTQGMLRCGQQCEKMPSGAFTASVGLARRDFYQTIGKIIYVVKEKIRSTICSNPGAWGLARRCWRVFDLHDFRSDGLLDMGLAQAKQAHAIGRISMHTGLKAATHLVHA